MKFYIISIILNMMILLIPVVKPGVLNKLTEERKIVTVNLEESTFEIPEVSPEKENQGTDIQKEDEGEKERKQSQKPIPVPERNTEEKNVQVKNRTETDSRKPSDEKTERKPAAKVENSTDKNIQAVGNTVKPDSDSKGGNPVVTSSGGATGKSVSDGTGTGKSSGGRNTGGNGKEGSSGGGTRGNGNKSSTASSENVCREGKDFTVSYNPNLKYPISMQRAGKNGTVVVQVRLNFNRNGSVSVISASGGNSVFQSEAKKTAARIKVNIKNPETLKCTITKPFRFNSV